MNYLDNYKPPLPNLLREFIVDVDLPKNEYAFKTYQLLLLAKRNSEALFLVIGKLLKEIRDQELFKELDYESFNQFLSSEELGYSRESAYLFIRAYEYLIEHLGLNPDAVGKMNISRINQMIPVLKKIEDTDGKDAAIQKLGDLDGLRHGDFVKTIKEAKKSTKPDLWYSEESKKWIVSFFDDMTILKSKGLYEQ